MNEHQNRKQINYSPVVCENLSPLQVVFEKQQLLPLRCKFRFTGQNYAELIITHCFNGRHEPYMPCKVQFVFKNAR